MIFRFNRDGELYIGYHNDLAVFQSYWMVPNLVNPYE